MSDMYFENLPSTSTPINATNLNKLNDVKVSSTQPNTGEKVWFKQGKNLINPETLKYNVNFNENTQQFETTNNWILTDFIPINLNVNYVFSHSLNSANGVVDYFDKDKNYLGKVNVETILLPFQITNSNAKYIIVKMYSLNSANETWMQLEQNSTATTYEPYIDKEIYVKNNNNNVYENFSQEYAKLTTTPQTPNGHTHISSIQLSYNNGFKLNIKGILDGIEHEFQADLTQIN